MAFAIVEKFGNQVSVLICDTEAMADDRAVKLTKINTSDSEEDIRDHLKQLGRHEEGDYGVYVTDAVRIHVP